MINSFIIDQDLELTNKDKKGSDWQDNDSSEESTEWLQKPSNQQPQQQYLKCIQDVIPSYMHNYIPPHNYIQ